jgi:asparagine synthase (glutamine-hydrolysing)
MTNSLRPPLLPQADQVNKKVERLRDLVVAQVQASPADGILFSGGLDTSVLATIAAIHGRRLQAVMLSVEEGTGLDEPFARLMAERLGIDLEILRPNLNELLNRMPELIRLLGTFDPMELRNSVVTYIAIEAAARRGLSAVLTGDAADELFAGYSYMFNMPAAELPSYIRRLNDIMHFTSQVMGTNLGVNVDSPYLSPAIRKLALTLDYEDLVCEYEQHRCGKRILREAFSSLLPKEIAWRLKTPIEYGSGSTALKQLTERSICDIEFEKERELVAARDLVKLRDKEQCFYYRIYRSLFTPPTNLTRSVKQCTECHGPVSRADMRYCRICGAYPI